MQKMRKPLHLFSQVMKFTLFQLLLIAFTFIAANAKDGNAQEILNQKISITMEDVKLKKAISFIESSASVYFTYNPQKIKTNQKISIAADNVTLETVLNQLFSPIAIDYKVYNNNHIVLNKRTTIISSTPEASVYGQVTDSDGEPLIGVNIQIKGVGTGTVTDIDGNYTIDAPDGSTLVFSYTGYSEVEEVVNGRSTINVTMSEGVDLESVTVLGSRGKPRTNVDRPVPIDVIGAEALQSTRYRTISTLLCTFF